MDTMQEVSPGRKFPEKGGKDTPWMEDREDISFVDQRFLSSRGLDDSNVLEYFSTSPFYDRSCNNEILKMQTQFRGLDQKSKLSTMVGVFYEAADSNADKTLFVVRKAYNHGDRVETIGMYYIMYGHVYPAPTTHSVYRCRMSDCAWILSTLISRMVSRRKFNPFNPTRIHTARRGEEDKDLEFMMEVFRDFEKQTDGRHGGNDRDR